MMLAYITCTDEKEAKKIARALLEKKLCCCSNIIPGISSLFLSDGKIKEEKESLLICKTKKEKFKLLEEEVKRLHSYETVCILGIFVKYVEKKFLKWLKCELS